MRLFKTVYKDVNGRNQKASKWYLEFRDHKQTARRMPAFIDKKQSAEIGRTVERLVLCRVTRTPLDAELTACVAAMPETMRDRLAGFGVLEAARLAGGKALTDHLDDFRKSLEANKRDDRYVRDTVAQVLKVLDGCGFDVWADLSASRIESFLSGHTMGKKTVRPVKLRTRNGYVTAMKNFANWLVEDGRFPYSPLAALKKVTITDQTDRRHLSVDEVRWLLCETEKGPDRLGVSGPDRALLYRVALETGLRAGELGSLTKASLDLDDKTPTVRVTKAQTKNAKDAVLDLTATTADLLRKRVENLMPAAPVLRLGAETHTAVMFRADLAATRRAWLAEAKDDAKELEKRTKSTFLAEFNEAGEQALFHSLRHTRGVWLFEHHRAHPREVQALMRLGSVALVDRYAKSFRVRDRTLVERAPDLSMPAAMKQGVAG